MKRKIFIFVIILLCFGSFTYAGDQIVSEFGNIFQIVREKFNNREVMFFKVNKLPLKDLYSGLVNDNTSYLDYLLVNYGNIDFEEFSKIDDPQKLQEKFIEELKNNKKFTGLLKDLSHFYLNKNDKKRQVVSLDRLLEIAVKFFAVTNINKDGKYIMHICVGMNLIKETEEKRLPHVEAFSFNSIMADMHRKGSILGNLSDILEKLYKIKFGIDKDKRLLRAQGAILMLMRENPKLKRLLLKEYKKRKDYLPFVVKINN